MSTQKTILSLPELCQFLNEYDKFKAACQNFKLNLEIAPEEENIIESHWYAKDYFYTFMIYHENIEKGKNEIEHVMFNYAVYFPSTGASEWAGKIDDQFVTIQFEGKTGKELLQHIADSMISVMETEQRKVNTLVDVA